MDKLILKTPSFNLMEDVYKKFGVEFHPNTPIIKIGEKLRRWVMEKQLPKLQQRYDKSIEMEKTLLIKLRKLQEKKKNIAWKLHKIKYHPAIM